MSDINVSAVDQYRNSFLREVEQNVDEGHKSDRSHVVL